MTEPGSVKFESFNTEQSTYTKPVSNVTETINFVGKISKGGLQGHSVSVTVTMPDGTNQPLSAFPTSSGSFKIGFPLNTHSQTGTYKAKVKYINAESDEITFQVLPNERTSDLIRKWILFPNPLEPTSAQKKAAKGILKTDAVSEMQEPQQGTPTAEQIEKIKEQFIQSTSHLLDGFNESMKTGKSNYDLINAINIIIVIFGVLLISFSIYYSWASQKFELFSAITAGVGVADFMALFLVNPQTKIRKNLADLVQMRMIYNAWIYELYSAYLSLTINGYGADNILKYQNSLDSLTTNSVKLIEDNIGNDTQSSNDQKNKGNSS